MPEAAFVGLEVVGDFSAMDGEQLVMLSGESKSVTSDSNPISNSSPDLWRTIRNWLEGAEAGDFQVEKTRLVLFVSRRCHGSIAELFNAAKTTDDASAAYKSVRKRLWDASKRRPRDDVPQRIRDDLSRFFSANPALATAVIRAFDLDFAAGSPEAALLDSIGRSPFVAPDMIKAYAEGILGWAKIRTDTLIAANRPAVIARADFRSQSNALLALLSQRNLLVGLKRVVTERERAEHRRERTYVRQLEFIEVTEPEILDAVADFIQAEADRTYWSKNGRVFEPSFDGFERELTAAWKYSKMAADSERRGSSDVEKGRALYAQCSLRDAKLEGISVSGAFCRGSLHKLADQPAIGWHPQYTKLLGARRRASNGTGTR